MIFLQYSNKIPWRLFKPPPLWVYVVGALGLGSLAAAGTWSWHWWQFGRFEEMTDNAYVRGDVTPIAPRVAGYVAEVPVADNQIVRRGDVLFRIQDGDYRARVAQAAATISMRLAALHNLQEQRKLQHALIAQAHAEEQSALAEQRRAHLDRKRYLALVRTSVAPRQRLETAEATATKADAAVDAAQATAAAHRVRLDVLAAQSEEAGAALKQAQAALDLTRIDLENTVVRAPVDGVIGNRQVRVGRYVTPGAPLLDVVPLDGVWVVANFKETQLARMATGQPVQIAVDGYPDARLAGVVDSLAPASGASFSLLPPDNATGNFIRIVQRVPVKIRLAAGQPLGGRLVPGLSVTVTVSVSRGPDLQQRPVHGAYGSLASAYREADR